MANIKTYDLIQCSRLYPTVNGANNTAFLPFVDLFVQINGDTQQSYKVKENVQARFFAPNSADAISNVQYSVTSIVFNGLECLNTTANLTVEQADNIYVEFPLYAASPTGYTSNVANAVVTGQSLTPTAFFERNFVDFMQALFISLDMNVEMRNSHPDWWIPDGFLSMKNFMIEMYSSDTLSITMTETYNGVSRELKYEVDGTSATTYIDGVEASLIPVPLAEMPQFGDVYSINSYVVAIAPEYPTIEIECCPILDPFYASLRNDCSSTVNVDCNCSKITFSDTSNYDNGLLGHDPSFFNHRTIILTKPDGTTYIWDTDGVVGEPASQPVNQIIPPHWNSSNMFSYSFSDSDQDGIYSVQICTYPDWQDGIYYDDTLNYMVYRNGTIYKQVSSSTGIDPALDSANTYWIEVNADDDRGRYCSSEKIVVLCLSIMKCYKKTVEEAMCSIKFNPCENMCDNEELMTAMKLRVTLDALEFATCAGRWDLVKEHIDILKSICCCHGC